MNQLSLVLVSKVKDTDFEQNLPHLISKLYNFILQTCYLSSWLSSIQNRDK